MRYFVKTTFGNGNVEALNICKNLESLQPEQGEDFVFDFSKYGENNPFSNIVLANSISLFHDNHSDIDMYFHPKDGTDGYLSHIGFYQACGIKYGKELGEARASSNYVPISAINLKGYDFYDAIVDMAQKLARTLQFDRSLQDFLTYIFTETIRNSFEHADVERVLVAAQKWPQHNLVEIAIGDSGIGIQQSLGKKFAMPEKESLRFSCKPGVSAGSNFYLDPNDPWRNSGYGLYTMKELALAYKGSFMICSGNYAFGYYNFHNYIERIFKTSYQGTAISLRFPINAVRNFDRIREEIVEKGQSEAQSIKGAIKTASKSSGGRYHL